MTRTTFAAALIGLLALLPVGAAAKEFTIGVENTQLYPIFGYRGGQYRGYSRELLDAFAAKHGYQFKYVGRPVVQLYGEFLGSNALDFKYPDSPNWRADLKAGIAITYSAPVFEGVEATMVLAEQLGKPLAEIKTLGIIRGFMLRPYKADIAAGRITLRESDNLPSLIQNALRKRVDAVLIHQRAADYYLSQDLKSPGRLVADPGLPSNDVAYMLSTRKHPEVIAEFNDFLVGEKALISRLKSKYQLD